MSDDSDVEYDDDDDGNHDCNDDHIVACLRSWSVGDGPIEKLAHAWEAGKSGDVKSALDALKEIREIVRQPDNVRHIVGLIKRIEAMEGR